MLEGRPLLVPAEVDSAGFVETVRGLMRVRKGGADLPEKVDTVPGIKRPPAVHQVLEGSSLHIFHYQCR